MDNKKRCFLAYLSRISSKDTHHNASLFTTRLVVGARAIAGWFLSGRIHHGRGANAWKQKKMHFGASCNVNILTETSNILYNVNFLYSTNVKTIILFRITFCMRLILRLDMSAACSIYCFASSAFWICGPTDRKHPLLYDSLGRATTFRLYFRYHMDTPSPESSYEDFAKCKRFAKYFIGSTVMYRQ